MEGERQGLPGRVRAVAEAVREIHSRKAGRMAVWGEREDYQAAGMEEVERVEVPLVEEVEEAVMPGYGYGCMGKKLVTQYTK